MTTKLNPADALITVYNGDEKTYQDTYPADWPMTALQTIARRWMKHTQGTRYTIRTGEGTVESKPRKGTK